MLTNNIRLEVVKLSDILEQIKPLLEAHYQEVAFSKDRIRFNPDYDKYLKLDEMGMLHCVCAFNGDSPVGYFFSFIQPNLHYQDHIYAANDVLYLDPSCRGRGVAESMFSFAEADLKKKGVSVITIHMKTHVPFDKLCEKLGYTYIERIYAKYIKD